MVTADTILGPYIQDIGILHSSVSSAVGGMTFNEQGTMLATALVDQNEVELFQFDRCTGNLSDFQLLSNISYDNNVADCAFSPSGKALYLLTSPSVGGGSTSFNALYQYTLDTSNINATKKAIWGDSIDIGPDQSFYFQSLRLAPNNKVYIDVSSTSIPYYNFDSTNQFLWVINNPDSLGLACNLKPYGFYLGDSVAAYNGLPPMPNYNLGPLNSIWQSTVSNDTFICKGDTASKGVVLTIDTAPGVSFAWQLGPGITDITLAQQTVNPTQSTWYYVTFTDTTIQNSCQSRTDSVLVRVICCDSLSLTQCALSKDTFICTNRDTPTKGAFLVVDTVPGISFAWQPSAGIVNVHSTQQIVDPSQSTWYYVTFFSDTNSNSCTRTDSVYVDVRLCDTLGIENVAQSNQHLTIYPNPAQDVATIEWQPVGEQDCSLAIYDLLGRQINSQKVDSTAGRASLDISGLSNGLYVVKLYMGNEVAMSGKLVVVR